MKKIFIIILILLISVVSLSALQFGKNKVKYEDMDWVVIETAHFDIYFEKGYDFFGKTAAIIIEKAYHDLQDFFEYSIPERVPVIIYTSHNKFQQTNVIYQLIDEGIGGFTEFIKNRVVVPFNGSYKKFELTLIHELTHVFQYYALKGADRGYTAAAFTSLPLWLTEGLAEFCSEHESDYSDMFMLDLMINGELIPLQEVSGYYAYREGQSFLLFLESKFGRDSLVELLYSFRISRSISEAAKRTFGYSFKDLEDQWKVFLQKKYSPYISDKELPAAKYEQLTFHKEGESSVNIHPEFSPDGIDILYFSDRTFNMSVYKKSHLELYEDKKMVESGGSGRFEEFPYMRNSISYFPDGEKFAFVTKTSTGDAISICDANTGKEIKRIKLDFDAIFELDVSPDGEKIVFVGLAEGKNDLYTYSLNDGTISRLTNDIFDDRQPRWAPDGTKIAFSSERFIDTIYTSSQDGYVFSNLYYNISLYDLNDDKIYAVTNNTFDNQYPFWSGDGNYLLFTSYRNHVSNIYLYNFSNQGFSQVTNVLSGVSSECISEQGDYLVFSGFYKKGWDLYLVSNPLDNLEYFAYSPIHEVQEVSAQEAFNLTTYKQYSRQRHAPSDQRIISYSLGDSVEAKPEMEDEKEPETKDYRLVFTPDLIFGGFGYSTGYGFSGQLYLSMSDILGNHHIQVQTDATGRIDDSNILVNYYYLEKRFDFGISLFNLVDKYYYLYPDGIELMTREHEYGLQTLVSYPLDKFNRFDLYTMLRSWNGEIFIWYDNDWHSIPETSSSSNIFSTALFYVHDTALWGMTGPVKGTRLSIGAEKSFGKYADYTNFYGDIRKYFPISLDYQFAIRLQLGSSMGEDKQDFIMGGYYNLRGYSNREYYGNNLAVASLEFRFPFIKNLELGFPLPLWMRNIRGALFTDIGTVWDKKEELDDNIKVGYGFGTRINLGYFVLKFDWGWPSDGGDSSFYISLNAEF
jgi:hypothetical protein